MANVANVTLGQLLPQLQMRAGFSSSNKSHAGCFTVKCRIYHLISNSQNP
jgi:hypothetical protein